MYIAVYHCKDKEKKQEKIQLYNFLSIFASEMA